MWWLTVQRYNGHNKLKKKIKRGPCETSKSEILVKFFFFLFFFKSLVNGHTETKFTRYLQATHSGNDIQPAAILLRATAISEARLKSNSLD